MGITYASSAQRAYSAVVNRIPLWSIPSRGALNMRQYWHPDTGVFTHDRDPGPSSLTQSRPANNQSGSHRQATHRQATHTLQAPRPPAPPPRPHSWLEGYLDCDCSWLVDGAASCPGEARGEQSYSLLGVQARPSPAAWSVCCRPSPECAERGCPRPMPILRCRCPPSALCATSTFASSASTSAEEAEAPTRRPRRRPTGRRRRAAGPGSVSTGAAAAASGRQTTRVRRRRATLALPADWGMQTMMAELASGTAATSLALPRCEERLFTPLALNRYCCDQPDDHTADLPTGRAGPGGLEHVIGLG